MDPTFITWPAIIAIIFLGNLSIITACIPLLRPFFGSLQSGMIRNDDLRRRGLSDAALGYEGPDSSGSSRESGKKRMSRSLNKSGDQDHAIELLKPQGIEVTNEFTITEEYNPEASSQTSRSKILKVIPQNMLAAMEL